MMPTVILVAYAIGSIPFALLVARWWGADDLRAMGSGNLGAANVFRVSGPTAGVLVALLDMAKGVASVTLARHLTDQPGVPAAAGLAAIVGHVYPVWLRFKGGKGLATGGGVMLAAAWPVGLMAAVTWLAMAFLFRISSLAALTAAALAPLFVFATDQEPIAKLQLAVFMAVLVFVRHAPNIRRLLRGEEPKIGAAASPEPPAAA